MKILLVDTSGPVCGAAIANDGDLMAEFWMKNKMTHSQKVMPIIDAVLDMADLTVGDMDAFAAVTGPGSFTGVRIGVATVKGLAAALGKPCIAVDALEALARNALHFEGVVCPILDARAGQVYCAAFEAGTGRRLMPDDALRLPEYLEQLGALNGPFLFVGDGVGVHGPAVLSALGTQAQLASPEHALLRPGCAALLATEKAAHGETMTADALRPLYLRAPQAERERAAKLAGKA